MIIYTTLEQRLQNQHEIIDEVLKKISKERVMAKPAPDKWSIHDNITHLAKYQVLFLERIQAIQEVDDLYLAPYIPEEDPLFAEWNSWETSELINRMKGDRESIATFILQLSTSQLARTAQHAKFGALTVPELVEFFLLHEAHHIFTMYKLAHNAQLPL
ncbi:MAG: DinB family protein [Ignavibacteria bacterium]|nr:DinB family protein [Ignavibacteria bacterium]